MLDSRDMNTGELVPVILVHYVGDLLDLPMEITVYNKTYKLGGFSVHAAGHYTAVTFLYIF